MANIHMELPSKGIIQNNFVRLLVVEPVNLNGIGTVEQQLCAYILSLTVDKRTVRETDSKWNVVLGKLVYEIINKGKGTITQINPENLLLINSSEHDTVPLSFEKDVFNYIGAQSFMLSKDLINLFIISVNGQVLDGSQYSISGLRQVNILDELEPEDQVIITYNLTAVAENPIVKINGITVINNTVNLRPLDLGLGNVNNTSDADKPISLATKVALNEIVRKAGFEHIQIELAYSWLIRHGLGKYPAVTVIGVDGLEYEGEVKHIDKDNVAILFSSPLKGTATFN